MKYKACRGIIFLDIPELTVNNGTCVELTRTLLVSHYNELVIQLKIAEHLINTSIYKEIREDYRVEVEKRERKIIELLQESILPLLDIAVSS